MAAQTDKSHRLGGYLIKREICQGIAPSGQAKAKEAEQELPMKPLFVGGLRHPKGQGFALRCVSASRLPHAAVADPILTQFSHPDMKRRPERRLKTVLHPRDGGEHEV
jgi:hypothetical protein